MKKRKPLLEPFGSIKLDSFIIYDSKSQSVVMADDKCLLCNRSDNPLLFLDLELVEDIDSPAYRGLQIHLALVARNIHHTPARKSIPSTRVDIYLSKDQAKELLSHLSRLLSQLGMLE